MLFDKNKKDFPSEVHKRIWYFGTHILPLDVTLPGEVRNSLPPELTESCEQMQRYFLHLFGDMYENFDLYKPQPLRTFRLFIDFCLLGQTDGDGLVIDRLAFDPFLKKVERSKAFKDDKKLGIDFKYRWKLFERTGLILKDQNEKVKLTNHLYPKMFYAMYEMAQISVKEKVSMANSFTYCDFRKLCKNYRYDKYENALIFLGEEDRISAGLLDSIAQKYKMSRSINSGHCPGYGVTYKYKKNRLMILNCLGNEILICIRIPFPLSDAARLDPFFAWIEQDSEELKKFFLKNIHRCCRCNLNCGGYTIQIYGKTNKICHFWNNAMDLEKQVLRGDIPLIDKILQYAIQYLEIEGPPF